MDDQILEDITVALDISEGFQYLNEVKCASIKYQETGNVYIYLKFPDDSVDTIGKSIYLCFVLCILIFIFNVSASFTAKMKFIVKDCDPLTGEVQDDGYQEDYRVHIILIFIIYLFVSYIIYLFLFYLNFSWKMLK